MELQVQPGRKVWLQTYKKKNYLSCHKGKVSATEKDPPKERDAWKIVEQKGGGGGWIGLENSEGKYLSVSGITGHVSCDRTSHGFWETFRFLFHNDDTVSLLSLRTRHFLRASQGGGSFLSADRPVPGKHEKFFLVFPDLNNNNNNLNHNNLHNNNNLHNSNNNNSLDHHIIPS